MPKRDKVPSSRRWRVVRRVLYVIVAIPAAYFLLVALGMLPANRRFRPPRSDGVDIYVACSPVHTAIIVPAASHTMDWRPLFPAGHFPDPRPVASHLQFGWGERKFCLETPNWDDLTMVNALRSLFVPSSSVMHVTYLEQPQPSETVRRITITREQYALLVDFLRQSFQQDEQGRYILISGKSYGTRDTFYEARGIYHIFNTCNCWTGQGLRSSGVRVGHWTPLTCSVMWTLPPLPAAAD